MLYSDPDVKHIAWPKDYFASRAAFVEQAQACGAHTESHSIKALGPTGEALSVDVASLISDQDEHRIILISGVHGVEGFIGGFLQLHALQALANKGPAKRTGVIMIHAANPWGFAHLRRVDENNIDVNRNFIDFENSQPSSHPNYRTLNSVINPKTPPTALSEIKYHFSASKLIAKNFGIKKLVEPIAQGQYDYPKGLFYGGKQVSASRALLETLIRQHIKDTPQVTLLDVHSGLGPSATPTLISNSNMATKLSEPSWLKNHYRQPVISDQAKDNPYHAQGPLSGWCKQLLSDKHYLYLCVEIGTVKPLTLFSALRRENQAYHWATPTSKAYIETKQKLKDVFAPQSAQWRNDALAQAMQVFDRTLNLPVYDPSSIYESSDQPPNGPQS